MQDAADEARRRRSNPAYADMLTNVDRSGYGGWVVRSLPADVAVDFLADGIPWARDRWTPGRYGK